MMFNEKFKISNEEFKRQLLYVLSEDREVLEWIRNWVSGNESYSELEIRPVEQEKNIGIVESEVANNLKLLLAEKEAEISKLNSEKEQWEEEMKLFKKLTKSYDLLMERFRYTENRNSELKVKSEEEEERALEYRSENNDLKRAIDSYKERFDESEKEGIKLKKKLESYEEQFIDMIETHKKFRELPSRVKESLSGIFKDETLTGFLACGVQEDNIESLWDYIKDELKEGNYQGTEELKEIFNYLFKLYKLSNPSFDWQEVEVSEGFDTDEHIRHSSGRVSGEIVEVMLRGYENKRTKRIVRKSLVKVG